MDPWPRIRRLPDGAIDYDFYRGKARAQRAAAIGNAVSRLKGLLDRLAVKLCSSREIDAKSSS